MGSTSRAMALNLRRDFNLVSPLPDDDLDRLCMLLDLRVETASLPGGREFVLGRRLILDVRLSRAWRRWLIAHAVGHVLCHTGNQLAMESLSLARQERQADDFAGWLLCAGCFAGCACEGDPRAAWQLAEDADVPVECVSLWLLSARRDLCLRCPAHRRGTA